MIFRFDDVCIQADIDLHRKMSDYLCEKFNGCKVIWAISPIGRHSEYKTQRVYPKEWNALSDYKEFFKLDLCGMPKIPDNVYKASHGLVHVDHRLLTFGAQELSILLSSSIVGSSVFVPPFNKWNSDTQRICEHNHIKLIKFEDDWKSMEYNKFNRDHVKWYLHAREWTLESFKEWFENSDTSA